MTRLTRPRHSAPGVGHRRMGQGQSPSSSSPHSVPPRAPSTWFSSAGQRPVKERSRVGEKQACEASARRRGHFLAHCCILYLGIRDLGPSHADLCQIRCKSGRCSSQVLAPLSAKTLTLGPQLVSEIKCVWVGGRRKEKGTDLLQCTHQANASDSPQSTLRKETKWVGGRELGRGLQSGKRGVGREAGAAAWGISADIKRMICK